MVTPPTFDAEAAVFAPEFKAPRRLVLLTVEPLAIALAMALVAEADLVAKLLLLATVASLRVPDSISSST